MHNHHESFNNRTETVEIEGSQYTFKCYYTDDGNKAISIINNNKKEDVLVYDEKSSLLLLNGKVTHDIEINSSSATNSIAAADWVTISSGTYTISWSKGTTVAIVAAAIAIYISTLGPAGVIAAIGLSSMGILAAAATGGTLYLTLQMFDIGMGTVQYRYLWSFRASTGDYYGQYVFMVPR